MSLPKRINLANCVPDPHRRANHILHRKTNEVFAVDEETYRQVASTHPIIEEDWDEEDFQDELEDGDGDLTPETLTQKSPAFQRLLDEAAELGVTIDPDKHLTEASIKVLIALGKANRAKKAKAEAAKAAQNSTPENTNAE
jgi:hypothetical protein